MTIFRIRPLKNLWITLSWLGKRDAAWKLISFDNGTVPPWHPVWPRFIKGIQLYRLNFHFGFGQCKFRNA